MNVDTEKLRLAEEAAELLLRVEAASGAERRKLNAECEAWMNRSPTHANELLLAKATHTHLSEMFRDGHIEIAPIVRPANNVHELVQCKGRHGAREIPIPAPRRSWRERALTAMKSTRFLAAAAVTCLIVVCAIVAITIQTTTTTQSIATELGEWTTKTLDDGTILRAGPNTKALVRFDDEQRLVHLSRGEILLDVAKDPTRPLTVRTDLATARAVGTAFAVSLDDASQIRVTVKEGIVAVARRAQTRIRQPVQSDSIGAIRITAGEQIVVKEAGPLTKQRVDVETALAWAEGRLIFKHETIEEAVREFNRRNRVQLKVMDEQLLHRAVRGMFAATDPLEFARYLERAGAVSVIDKDATTVLIASRSDRTETTTLR